MPVSAAITFRMAMGSGYVAVMRGTPVTPVHWGQSRAPDRLDQAPWSARYLAPLQLPMWNQDHHCIHGCTGRGPRL